MSAAAPFAPIFIMGAHRSGTTWLQQLLVETGCFDYVSAFHVICYDRLPREPMKAADTPAYRELVETFARLGVDTRDVDDVRATPDLAEEYGFILHNAGTGFGLTRANLPLFHQICRRIRTSAQPRPIVLKNPWDAGNFLFVKRVIPDARFLFIHRHPQRVIHSALSSARILLASRNAYTALLSRHYDRLFGAELWYRARLALHRLSVSRHLGIGVRHLTAAVSATNLYFFQNVARLPRGDYLSLRYEDLCERPVELLGRVFEFVGGIDPARASALRTPAKPRRGDVMPEVKWYSRVIAQKTAAYRAMHGYRAEG
jgi:hypothetical protein